MIRHKHCCSVIFVFLREALERQVCQELLESQGNPEIQEAQYVLNNKSETVVDTWCVSTNNVFPL